jgi:hypothetical protein
MSVVIASKSFDVRFLTENIENIISAFFPYIKYVVIKPIIIPAMNGLNFPLFYASLFE